MTHSLNAIQLVDPVDLELVSDGYGQYPNGYKLTEKGIRKIMSALRVERLESFGIRAAHSAFIPGANLILHHPETSGYQVFETDPEVTQVIEVLFSETLEPAIDYIQSQTQRKS